MDFFNYEQLNKHGLIKSSPRVLDLGCGSGRYSKPFYENGADITLVDKKVFEIDYPAKVVQSDIRDFVPEGQYDIIFMRNVLSFLSPKEDIGKVISKMYEALAPGGMMAFTVFGENDPWVKEEPNMSFVSRKEFIGLLPNKPYSMNEKEGIGFMMNGKKKYWHIFEAVIVK